MVAGGIEEDAAFAHVRISDRSTTFNDGRFVPVFAGDGDSGPNFRPVAEG